MAAVPLALMLISGTLTNADPVGELSTEVWYDDAGRWVKLRFPGSDGSTIEFVCQQCRAEREQEQTS